MLNFRSIILKETRSSTTLIRYPVSVAALAVPITLSTEKRNTVTAPADEMCQQFQGRIMCGRCGNSECTKFAYTLPVDGRLLVQCSHCGLTFFKWMEPSQNNNIQK